MSWLENKIKKLRKDPEYIKLKEELTWEELFTLLRQRGHNLNEKDEDLIEEYYQRFKIEDNDNQPRYNHNEAVKMAKRIKYPVNYGL